MFATGRAFILLLLRLEMSDRKAQPQQNSPSNNIRVVPVASPVQGAAFYPQPVILQPGAQYYPGQVVQAPYQILQVK